MHISISGSELIGPIKHGHRALKGLQSAHIKWRRRSIEAGGHKRLFLFSFFGCGTRSGRPDALHAITLHILVGHRGITVGKLCWLCTFQLIKVHWPHRLFDYFLEGYAFSQIRAKLFIGMLKAFNRDANPPEHFMPIFM